LRGGDEQEESYGLAILSFLIIPGIANATFFDDGRWYVDFSQWEDYSVGVPPFGGTATLVDTPGNDRLDWITSGWTNGQDVFRAKGSKWTFDLNNDFEFTVGVHYNHGGTYETDEGDIGVGIFRFLPTVASSGKNSQTPFSLKLSSHNVVHDNEDIPVY